MAKQCIYCGRPLAKDDARFCNDCGRLQISPTSAEAGEAAPSAIKVKLPPREFTRADPPPPTRSERPEISSPGQAANAASVIPSAREQALPPSSRMPRRPARLTPSEPGTPADKAETLKDAFASLDQAPGSAPPAKPMPAEEISTMVLPNWREELAKLRKEQEQAGMMPPPVPEKKRDRATSEPPPLPRRGPNTPLPPLRTEGGGSSPAQPNLQAKTFPDTADSGRTSQDKGRPAELSRPLPETPLPRNSARPAELPRRAPNTPLPPQENRRPTEDSRRELHVKVWEQEATIQYPMVQGEPQEVGPAPAVEQNPFANVTFGLEEQTRDVAEEKTLNWQAPRSPIPPGPERSPLKEEKRPPAKIEGPASAEEKRGPAKIEGPASGEEEKRPQAREEARAQTREERPATGKEEGRMQSRGESGASLKEERRPQPEKEAEVSAPSAKASPTVEKDKDDIEDLPTARLAVPEVAKQEPQIKIERASTPAPRKWTTPPAEEVEDLPTRPLAASSASPAGPATPRPPQQPAMPQTPGGERRPEQGPGAAPVSPGPRTANPPSMPGSYAPAAASRPAPTGQIAEPTADPLASRMKPAQPGTPPGPTFNPASLPPLPPGPISSPGNPPSWPGVQGAPAHPSTPFPDTYGQRPPQAPDSQYPPSRPPSFGPASAPPVAAPSVVVNAQNQATAAAVEKPRKKRHTGRLLVVILLIVLIAGGAAWYVLYQPFTIASASQPYQTYRNSAFGISVDYTQGWRVNVDQAHSTIRFADSSHTGQANLVMADASGQVSDYLNQQITQQGITGSKAAPAATFAGASWQAVQGTVTQTGATYKVALYATQHNGHIYMLEFLAPQSAFSQIDQSTFIHMRSSFSFL